MSDDPTKRGPGDRTRISLSEPWEVNYWTKALGVTRDALEAAVKAVGNMAEDVRRHLGK